MNVIDQILSDWSYRCSDGIVDLDNPQKVKVLFEILRPLLTEDMDDEILNALIGSDSTTKEKVLKFLKRVGDINSNDSLEKQVEAQLKPKLRQDIIEQVITISDSRQYDVLEELHNYLKNPKITYDDLVAGNNFNTLFSDTGFSDGFINRMIEIKGASQPAIGKGEVAIILFIKNASKASKGDVLIGGEISINGTEIEVKGVNSKVADEKTEIGSKEIILSIKTFQNFINKYKQNITIKSGNQSWVDILHSGYNNINNKQEYINDIVDVLQDQYPSISGISLDGNDFSSTNSLSKKIATIIAKNYLKDKDLLFFNKNNNYVYIKGYDDYVSKIEDGTLSVGNPSDRIPRLSYLS
jgi:hypothetical protein